MMGGRAGLKVKASIPPNPATRKIAAALCDGGGREKI
jgi:hypothetical protein